MTNRKPILISVFLSLCLCSREPSRHTKPEHAPSRHLDDTVTVMVYNVENMFDMVKDGGEYPEYIPNAFGWNDFTYGVKLHNIGSVIAAARPDVAVIAEVENHNALNLLMNETNRLGAKLHYSAVARKPERTAVTLGVMSAYPVISSRSLETVRTEDGTLSRSILEARILLGTDTLIVFVNHWPAQKHPESYRVAAARVLARRLKELPPGTDYLIAGDLNSNWNELETGRTKGLDDADGMTGVNHVLGTVSSAPGQAARYIREQDLGSCPLPCHYDLWHELPEQDRWSYVYKGERMSIDHIIIPAALCDSTGVSYVDQSFRVFTNDGALLKNGRPWRWETKYRGKTPTSVGAGFSDHLPVIARLRCRPFAAVAHDSLSRTTDSGVVRLRLAGFENGVEGWIAADNGMRVARDRTGTGYSLKIAGTAGKNNCTAARTLIPATVISVKKPREVRLALKGEGVFGFRARAEGSKKWAYYNAPAFVQTKSAKYMPFKSEKWSALVLPIAGIVDSRKDVALELRVGKGTTVAVWIDNIEVR